VLWSALLGLSLVLALTGTSLAQTGAEVGYPALVNNVPARGVLTGNRAGTFAYYTLEYPGDLRVVTIELHFAPADPVTRLGFGFNVYGPGGFAIGQGAADTEDDGEPVQLQYSDANRATWLVQVYNYIPGHQVSYSLVAGGLPEAQVEPAPSPAPTEPSLPEPPSELGFAVSGALLGKAAGAYAFYELDGLGQGTEVTLTMAFSPDDPVISPGVGFAVYGPSGEVARGESTGLPGQRKAVFAAEHPGPYLIQVFNYIEGVLISYSLTR
jgi:hypothetical protein